MNKSDLKVIADGLKGMDTLDVQFPEMEQTIESLSDAERVEVQRMIGGACRAPQNLFFNYKTQKWIGA